MDYLRIDQMGPGCRWLHQKTKDDFSSIIFENTNIYNVPMQTESEATMDNLKINIGIRDFRQVIIEIVETVETVKAVEAAKIDILANKEVDR
ncbi:hypothetical protein F8M41_011427 [Gigaspora margarita]|uniref:Uncharacterized protein n=1 Tax=Gigaspora margarita TaxID=4874 RepID=A0A8H4ATW6_GIGMA|nr:hypothetical protein F8M41_011427 [Gigaspora margarita]